MYNKKILKLLLIFHYSVSCCVSFCVVNDPDNVIKALSISVNYCSIINCYCTYSVGKESILKYLYMSICISLTFFPLRSGPTLVGHSPPQV